MPLPTAEQIRNISLKSLESSGADARITTLISAADKVFARWCLFPPVPGSIEPTMEAHAFTQIYDGPDPYDSDLLRMKLRPLVTVTQVAQDVVGDATYSEVWVANTDYTVMSDLSSILRMPASVYAWMNKRRSIRVTGTYGFDVGANEALTLAYAIQVSHWWTSPGALAPQVVNLSQGGSTVSLTAKALPVPEARSILQMYKLTERELP